MLTVSTALTFDRWSHCVEGAGILVDELIVPDRGLGTGTQRLDAMDLLVNEVFPAFR